MRNEVMVKIDNTGVDIASLAEHIETALQELSPDNQKLLFTLVTMIPDAEGFYTVRAIGNETGQHYMAAMNRAVNEYSRDMTVMREGNENV